MKKQIQVIHCYNDGIVSTGPQYLNPDAEVYGYPRRAKIHTIAEKAMRWARENNQPNLTPAEALIAWAFQSKK